MCQFRLASLFVGDEQKIDHLAAGILARQITLQHRPGLSIFGPGEQVVAVDRVVQGLWFALWRMDDMVLVNDMKTMAIIPPARPRMSANGQSAPRHCTGRTYQTNCRGNSGAFSQGATLAGQQAHGPPLNPVCLSQNSPWGESLPILFLCFVHC